MSDLRPSNRLVRPLGGSARGWLFAGRPLVPALSRQLLREAGILLGPPGGVTQIVAEPALVVDTPPGQSLGDFLALTLPGLLAVATQTPGSHLLGTPDAVRGDILAQLGLSPRLLTLTQPTRFAALLRPTTLPPGVHAADAAYLALCARLRAATRADVPSAVALLPPPEGRAFTLRNRASLSAWLRARRFALPVPEQQPFQTTAAQLGRATTVLLADPAQAGLLGLCQPGTRILELAPEGASALAVRGLAQACGLDWRLFFGSPLTWPISRRPPLGAGPALSYEIPIHDLAQALARL